jgi:hypothetical protein
MDATECTEEKDNKVQHESSTPLLEMKFDKLGPIIINTDGTMSKIPNWEQLTEAERINTLRLIAKRNKIRKENLLAEQQSVANGVESVVAEEQQDSSSVLAITDA